MKRCKQIISKRVASYLLGLIVTTSFTLSAANTGASQIGKNQAGSGRTSPDQILVKIGQHDSVTSIDLEKVIKSSPFYTQFNTMTSDQQALIRGDLLKRLVASKLLAEEAKAEGLDKTAAFKQELSDYRTSLLYNAYLHHIRDKIKIPKDELAQIRKDNKSSSDAYSAAKVIYISTEYKKRRRQALQRLEKQANVTIFQQRIKSPTPPDTILLTGKNITIRYKDVVTADEKNINPDAVLNRLQQSEELLLFSQAARKDNISVEPQLLAYKNERLPDLMLEKKIQQWIPDETVLKKYYKEHPKTGVVPQFWHVGQVVLKTRKQAKEILQRIKKGESLFTLAGKYSIDSYGRSKNGDMGWIADGKVLPQINAVLKDLPVNKVSPIIKTPKGYHIVEIIDAKPGSRLRYNGMKSKIKQLLITQKMGPYLKSLYKKYLVSWKLVQADTAVGAAKNSNK